MKAATKHARRLWTAGDGRCGVCGQDVPMPGVPGVAGKARPTLEHVFPKSPQANDLRRIRLLQRFLGSKLRLVIAHWGCNHRKGNRAPTACEVIFLMAVNARLPGAGAPTTSAERTAARKERRRHARGRQFEALAA